MSQPQKTGDKHPKAAETGRHPAAAVPPPMLIEEQIAVYEAAMRLFHGRKFQEARDTFARAVEGPDRAVAHRADLHIRMCERRLGQAQLDLRTAEDYYNYGVALVNSRDLEKARQHLSRAVEMSPNADHVHYALALCYGLSGDLHRAYDSLKRAIELNSYNRISARQDPDFGGILSQPPFDTLLYPERKPY